MMQVVSKKVNGWYHEWWNWRHGIRHDISGPPHKPKWEERWAELLPSGNPMSLPYESVSDEIPERIQCRFRFVQIRDAILAVASTLKAVLKKKHFLAKDIKNLTITLRKRPSDFN